MKDWQHKVIRSSFNSLDLPLQEEQDSGGGGWELVSVVVYSIGAIPDVFVLFFKREISHGQ